MHGKVWMFSHLIDDEDLEFLQREFISYQQAMDYYKLGYKPVVKMCIRDSADTYIRIPMAGEVESLNAAIASAVLMFEAGRQRRSRSAE